MSDSQTPDGSTQLGLWLFNFPTILDFVAMRPRHKHELISLSHQVIDMYWALTWSQALWGLQREQNKHPLSTCRCPPCPVGTCVGSQHAPLPVGKMRNPRLRDGGRLLSSHSELVAGIQNQARLQDPHHSSPAPELFKPLGWGRLGPLAQNHLISQVGLR